MTPVIEAPFLLRPRTGPAGREARSGRKALADAGLVRGEAHISVRRTSPDDVGFREIFVSLDGEPLGMLRHGESLTADVAPGPHRLRAHNTLFWRTHALTLRPGEHAHFTAINRAGWGTFGMLFIIGAMPVYLTFERTSGGDPTNGEGPPR